MSTFKGTHNSKLFIFSLLFFLLILLGGNNNDVNADPPGLEIAKKILEQNSSSLMANDDVAGTALGLDDNGNPVIKVFLLTGQSSGIPQSIKGIPIQTEITGMFIALSDPTSKFPRPVPIGVSTGHPSITAGTIGCRATDGTNFYALSNNHVYADINNANIGDNVIQPGSYDGGQSSTDTIGTLYDYEPIDFSSNGNNTIDAAIAITSDEYLDNYTPADDGYGSPSSSTVTANIGLNVMKYGRTTGLTYGVVNYINATANVCYECAGALCIKCKKLANFTNQFIITPGSFSAGGDSGSLIVTDNSNNDPVGLLFAGSSNYTIANPIGNVFSRFNITCDDGTTVIDPPDDECTVDADCDDDNICNGDETCDSGSCISGTSLNCDDSNACTEDICDSVSGCTNDTISCDDNNACTVDSCDINSGCINVNDGSCICASIGDECVNNSDCCTNKCKGRPGFKTCK